MDEFLLSCNDRMTWLIHKLIWLTRCGIDSVIDEYAYYYKGKRFDLRSNIGDKGISPF